MTSKSQNTRDHILETASQLFYQNGYNQTSFSDIARQAGIPKGNFYYHFKSKGDILLAVIQGRIERSQAMLEQLSTHIDDPVERLCQFIDGVTGDENITRFGCPMGSLTTELGKGEHAFKQQAREMMNVFVGWLVDQFRGLGRIEDAEFLSKRLLSRAQGITVLAHIYDDSVYIQNEAADLKRWLVDELRNQSHQ